MPKKLLKKIKKGVRRVPKLMPMIKRKTRKVKKEPLDLNYGNDNYGYISNSTPAMLQKKKKKTKKYA